MQMLENDALVTRLHELRSTERRLLVDFLEHLAELDRRRLYLELSYGSCFAYCMDALGLTESSAYRRITAARLLARFPVVADYLRDGRLCVTTLVELAGVLNDDNLHDWLARAAGKTQKQIKAMVRPVDTFSKKVTLVVDEGFLVDLEKVRADLSHKVRSGRIEEVLHECMRVTLKKRAKRARGRGKRYTPARVRDHVLGRDGYGCDHHGPDGKRCGSTWQVELHHVERFADGGGQTENNLVARCGKRGKHNRWYEQLSGGARP